ncbi:MAG: phosphate/phosphite/phosphonate ABC transporter substrate-binding protein [Gammaproteobacteria bacterium]|nr:phosphate/phosphite/phosphonate ABC transporter substrate-binding protein [Gammaproteobacteria bacterium]MDH5803340.1 phosphate/phosphite/phosphonate ABC transporter substrate-binding protein [Gammaproteobacteria bacterium]
MKFLFIAVILLFSLSETYANNRSDSTDTYVLARAPQRSHVKTVKDWEPFAEFLRTKTGADIRLKVYDSRDHFEHDLLQGKVDLVYANPGYLIAAKELIDYQPLVRSGKRKLTGIIVTRKSSGINSLQDLSNKTLAFPDKNAFAASLYVRSILDNENIPFQAEYVNGHDNVYRNVANGKFIAGGGVYRTLDREPTALRTQLQVIYETPGMSPHPLFAHPRVPKNLRDRIVQIILAMPEDTKNAIILERIKIHHPVKADFQTDYASIRSLALQMYKTLLQSQQRQPK